MNAYTIVMYETTPTAQRLVLSRSGSFCVATNDAMRFTSRADAENFATALRLPRLFMGSAKVQFADAIAYMASRKCIACVRGPRGAERVARKRTTYFIA